MFAVQSLLKITVNKEKCPLFGLTYFFTLINNVVCRKAIAV